MAFGARIKAVREELGLTQETVVERVRAIGGDAKRFSQSTLKDTENRDSRKSTYASPICHVLRIHLQWALIGQGPKWLEEAQGQVEALTNGSTSEPELPENLSPMARECISRIAAAAAKADGKFDDFLAHIAAEIERTVDLPVKSPRKVRPMSKEQLSLVKTVTTMGGLIPDAQASAIDTMVWGYIRLEDPDAELPVVAEGSKSRRPAKAKP